MELKVPVYEQSVATPIKATFLVPGQPTILPMLDLRFTDPEFPPLGMPLVSSCRFPKNEPTGAAAQYPTLRLSSDFWSGANIG